MPYPASSQSPQYTISDERSQLHPGNRDAALPDPNTARVPGTVGRHKNTSRFSTMSTRGMFQTRQLNVDDGMEQSVTGQPRRDRSSGSRKRNLTRGGSTRRWNR